MSCSMRQSGRWEAVIVHFLNKFYLFSITIFISFTTNLNTPFTLQTVKHIIRDQIFNIFKEIKMVRFELSWKIQAQLSHYKFSLGHLYSKIELLT